MGVVRVDVSDPYIAPFQEAVRGSILAIESVGAGRRYTLLVPEMADCEAEIYPIHAEPVYIPFASCDPEIEEIWVVPHIESV